MATYTSNYAWTMPEGGDAVDIAVLNGNLSAQDSLIHDNFLQYADVFSELNTYPIGAVVLYSNAIYKCHTAVTVAGTWTGATNWTGVTVADLDKGGGGAVLEGTLTTGSTSITLTDASITTSSFYEFYTSVYGVSPTSVSETTGSITLTFTAQGADINVAVRVLG